MHLAYTGVLSEKHIHSGVKKWGCEGGDMGPGHKMSNQQAYLNWPEHLRRSFCFSSGCACPRMWLCALDLVWRENNEY